MSAVTAPLWVALAIASHPTFPSKHVDARNIDVWLPRGYDEAAPKRYPVVYMHDGQMLWDPADTWNHQSWEIDAAMTRLIAEKRIREAIVVGIWSTDKRFREYMPRKPVGASGLKMNETEPPLARDAILSDAYLEFLVHELKPFIDSTYRTLPGRDDTFILGSSMGGLISIYALTEYPDVFGGAAGISTHWPAGADDVIPWLEKHLPAPGRHRIYFDFGTETLDAAYEPHQRQVDEVMKRRGYREGVDWTTRKFEGADHSEKSWSARVDVPLTFLLRKGDD